MIDTLSIARNLCAAGLAQPQAEAIAEAIADRDGESATKDFVRAEVNRALLWSIGTGIALAAASVTVLGLWIGG